VRIRALLTIFCCVFGEQWFGYPNQAYLETLRQDALKQEKKDKEKKEEEKKKEEKKKEEKKDEKKEEKKEVKKDDKKPQVRTVWSWKLNVPRCCASCEFELLLRNYPRRNFCLVMA